MGVIGFKHSGNFDNLERFLKGYNNQQMLNVLNTMGQEGVDALSSATPIDSGNTAGSWGYEIKTNRGSYSITWTNSNVNKGVPIAILIQYGHATGTGGYVEGYDYINPAIRPVFDRISETLWEEMINL